MKRCQFLLFDLDYTLLDFDADMTMAFEKLYESHSFGKIRPYSPATLDLYEHHNNAWWRKFENGECTKQELFRNRFVDFLKDAGFSGDPDKLNEDYFDFLGTGGVPYPGALDMIQKLSEKSDIYITTNGNAATAKTRIENSGVGRYIKDYFVSEAIGFAKPDRRYFDYVAAHIPGFQKEKALVIGDSLLTDIQGANNAGLHSLWYHPSGRHGEDSMETPYTYRAGSYEEILRLLLHE